MKIIKVIKCKKGGNIVVDKTIKNLDKESINATISIVGSANIPMDGIWWYIDSEDKFIIYSEKVTIDRHIIISGGFLHEEEWKHICDKYKVNDRIVSYTYFPRGRIAITPEIDDEGNFIKFDCKVYGDPCVLCDEDLKDRIENEFNLFVSRCEVEYCGDWYIDGSHYVCHQCKGN